MNQAKAKLFFAEYRRGTLDARTAAQIRELLESDAELKSAYEVACRLQDLIALKRHEMPKPGSLDTFLAEFHRRQRSEAQTSSLWTRFQQMAEEYLQAPASGMLRYAQVAAAMVILIGISFLYSQNHSVSHDTFSGDGAPPSQVSARNVSAADLPIANVSVVLANNVSSTPVNYVLQRVNYSTSQNGFTRFDF